MIHTLEVNSFYCRSCKKVNHSYGVAFGGVLVSPAAPRCRNCNGADLEQIVECEACGHAMRESAALWSESEDKYFCSDCRTACSCCGNAIDKGDEVYEDDGTVICSTCEWEQRLIKAKLK